MNAVQFQRPSMACALALAASIVMTESVEGATFHVSSRGDDQYTQAMAQSPHTPWKTLQRLDSVLLYPGDSILLERGDTLFGTLRPRLKADVDWTLPITISGFGTGPHPVVTGARRITSWKVHPTMASTWYAPLLEGETVARLMSGATPQNAARLPRSGWYVMRSPEGDSAFEARELPGGDWVGAYVHLKSKPWNIDSRRVASQSGQRLSLEAPASTPLTDGWGYFLSGVPAALSGPGQWAQDASQGRILWMPPAGVDPNRMITRISVVDYGFWLRGLHDISVDGIDFYGQAQVGIEAMGTSNIQIRNCMVIFADQWGIKSWGGDNMVVENCRAFGSSAGGILLVGRKAVARSNTVKHIGHMNWLGPKGFGDMCCGGRGLQVSGDSSQVLRNTVQWTGWTGIHFTGNAQLVEENVVDSAVQTSNDGGGLYSFGSEWGRTGQGTVVRRNLVTHTLGNPSGTPWPQNLGLGLYLDNDINGMLATENVFVQNSIGVLLHNNRDIAVVANEIEADSIGIWVSHDVLGHGEMYGNTVEDNRILVTSPGRPMKVDEKVGNGGDPVASYQRNLECFDHPLVSECIRDGLTLWAAPRFEHKDRRILPERYTATSGKTWGWGVYPASLSVTPLPGARADSMALTVRRPSDPSLRIGVLLRYTRIPLQAGELSYVTFKARARGPGMKLSLAFLQGHDGHQLLAPKVSFELDTEWRRYATLFRAGFSDSGTRVDFMMGPSDTAIDFDSLSWMAVDESGLPSGKHSFVAIGSRVETFWYSPVGSWRDLSGDALPGSGMIPPLGSIIGIREGGGEEGLPEDRLRIPIH
ncbi:MAG: right-handed parallel beta-helix repeat-containing protein [Fibrobacteria bacterium]|nr:right-handed parallel beta-helix repeat-containing protein [Fibrobacteria bacterium]